MATYIVGNDGKAPANAKPGDKIVTGGGVYEKTATGSIRVGGIDTPTGTSSNMADVQNTFNRLTGGGSPGGSKGGGGSGNKGGSTPIATPSPPPPVSGNISSSGNKKNTAVKTSYVAPDNTTQTGYIINGVTYKDEAGKERIDAGSIVTAGGKKYLLTQNGSRDATGGTDSDVFAQNEDGSIDEKNPIKQLINIGGTNYDRLTGNRYRDVANDGEVIRGANGKYYNARTGEDVSSKIKLSQGEVPPLADPALQNLVQEYYDMINQEIALDPTLTWEQAFARAMQTLNPEYNEAMTTAMAGLDQNALQSGFFGQLPTEALKRETAGKLEVSKLQAVNQLASQLFGQSEDSAYKKLSSETQNQQNKIANFLNLLGIYTNERGYQDSRQDTEWEKAFKEGQLIGNYNGKPTLDFMQEQRQAASSSGGGGGGGGSKTGKPKLTAAQARSALNDAIKSGTITNDDGSTTYKQPSVSRDVVDAYNYWYGADYDVNSNGKLIKNGNEFSRPKVDKIIAGLGGNQISQGNKTTIVSYVKDLYEKEAISKKEANYILGKFGFTQTI